MMNDFSDDTSHGLVVALAAAELAGDAQVDEDNDNDDDHNGNCEGSKLVHRSGTVSRSQFAVDAKVDQDDDYDDRDDGDCGNDIGTCS